MLKSCDERQCNTAIMKTCMLDWLTLLYRYNLQRSGVVSAFLITNVYFWVLESQTNHVLSHFTGATLQNDAIANFQLQSLGYY